MWNFILKINCALAAKKSCFTLLFAIMASVGTILASDTQVHGIWYNFNDDTKTAEVTYRGPSSSAYSTRYSGVVVIPASVEYNSSTYSVTSIGVWAFDGCSGLTSITIPNSVTSIGYYAFENCTGLTSIEIPNSVTSIGGSAFSNCSGLTSIEIPNSVTSIGESAFNACSGLTSVTIPNSVTSIADGAFNACSGLTSVTIPNSVTSIEAGAFYGCSGLTSIEIPNSVTSIADGAFNACSGLISVTIGNSVTSIGEWAFAGCSGLTSIEIPNSITSIEAGAFYGCSGLTNVEIPNSVTSIGGSAFSGCSGLTNVTIGSGVTSIGGSAFSGCSGLTNVTIGSGVTSIGGRAFYGCSGLISVTIPNSVTSIGEWAFDGCSGLTSLTIPNSVTSIEAGAFYGCSGLTSLTIGNSVTSIGERAFYNCTGLTEILIDGDKPATMEGSSFYDNPFSNTNNCPIYTCYVDTFKQAWPNYADRIFPHSHIFEINGVVNIAGAGNVNVPITICEDTTIVAEPNYGYHFVQWSDGVTDNPRAITLTQDTTFTAEFAYDRTGKCGKDFALTWTYSPDDKTLSISGNGALEENLQYGAEAPSQMEHIIIEEGVISMDENAFSACSNRQNLTSVTINSNAIASKEYSDNSSLGAIFGNQVEEYIIGPSVTSIGIAAFYGCSNLRNITLPNSITSIGTYAFGECSNLTAVTIPNSVTSIEEGTFYQCSSLTSATIPSSVTSIGDGAFYECSGLRDVTIPNNVINIGYGAFYSCVNLASIVIPNSVTSLGGAAFLNCSSLTSVVVPENVKSIGVGATFQKCTSLVSVQWNAIDCAIETNNEGSFSPPFYNLTNITDFSFGKHVKSIPSTLCYGMSGITAIELPSSITSIGNYAFYNCDLTSVSIPEGCTSVGTKAFAGNQHLITINIPSTLATIGNVAANSQRIETVYNYAMTPQTMSVDAYGSDKIATLRSVLSLATLYVPAQSVNLYKNAELWRYFGSILPIPSTIVETDDIKIETTETTANIIWPSVSNVDSYELVIKDGDGNIICTLIFDSEGHLVSLAFAAPSRDKDTHQEKGTGFGFTVTGLKGGTTYNFTFTAKDNTGNVIEQHTGTFTTKNDENPTPTPASYAFAVSHTGLGTVNSDKPNGKYEEGTIINIEAIPATDWTFNGWSDGVNDAKRAITLSRDTALVATFTTTKTYKVTVVAGDNGTVEPAITDKEYVGGSILHIVAAPNEGFKFVEWSDGNEEEERDVVITQDTVLQASFKEIVYYQLEVLIEPQEAGTVLFNGQIISTNSMTVAEGRSVTLTAEAAQGYLFDYYLDGSNKVTEDTYKVKVSSNKTVKVFFKESTQDIDEIDSSSVPQKVMKDGQIYILRGDKIYTITGAEVK